MWVTGMKNEPLTGILANKTRFVLHKATIRANTVCSNVGFAK